MECNNYRRERGMEKLLQEDHVLGQDEWTPLVEFHHYLQAYPERFVGKWPKGDPWGAYFVVIHPRAGRPSRWFVLPPMRERERQEFLEGFADWLRLIGGISVWKHPTTFLAGNPAAKLVWSAEQLTHP